jgi:hypothetical protein
MHNMLTLTDHLLDRCKPLSRWLDQLAERVVPQQTAHACTCPIHCGSIAINCPFGLKTVQLCGNSPSDCGTGNIWSCQHC